MAIKEYIYQRTTFADLTKALRWAVNKLNLRDWEIELDYGDCVPDWAKDEAGKDDLGYSLFYPYRFCGNIWIAGASHKKDNENLIQTLFHEVIHALVGMCHMPEAHKEIFPYRFESLLFELYYRETGRKLPRCK